ncbi:hypothetical protein MB02_01275 [Croceicoccus estronivorus]|uniref:hypothetical protein n=1 Tax=Croceicoccus estronivorus TaxID=1172626 RepID=UPI000835D4A4|nr:hypothetical protein [Croceicoccus estronivorus]OCC25331.1 hypothetical protein MB02_01275 [Croceicoccus estronivorus]
MTIPRKPTTFARALTEIALLLGWDECAEVLGKSESHVRKLGAPDTERELSLRDAVRLDAAYRRAGGEGAPLLECYALKLDLRMPIQSASPHCMLTGSAKAAKESGEAVAAAIELAGNSNDPHVRMRAVREVEEAITEFTRLLTRIVAHQEQENRQ